VAQKAELKAAEEGKKHSIYQPLRTVTTPEIPGWVSNVTVTSYEGPEGSSVASVFKTEESGGVWGVELNRGPNLGGFSYTVYVVTYRVKWHAE
jgi:hypothetical protein